MADLLKDKYNQQYYEALIHSIRRHYAQFNGDAFLKKIYVSDWENKSLKERMRHTTEALHSLLPQDYQQAVSILLLAVEGMRSYDLENLIFPDFVEVYGLEHWNFSLAALEEFTLYFSAEFAVRPFILRDEERMMKQMLEWAGHSNHHVRRLASEGCRPRLPWAMALPRFKRDPSRILPILEKLKADPSEYVRRSVANNLNDISKDHPDLVIQLAHSWLGKCEQTDGLVKHALRTLLKKSDSRALALFGFADIEHARIEEFSVCNRTVEIGGALEFRFVVRSQSSEPQRIRLEYQIEFVKAGGRRSSKVFQISERTLQAGELVDFRRTHSLRQMSTRKHYPGEHRITIRLNGDAQASEMFQVLEIS